MSWVAIIPLKQGGGQKSRLSPALSNTERERLMDGFFRHVLTVLRAAPEVARVIVLSPRPPAPGDIPWCADRGRGLNAELDALRARLPGEDFMVVHADLPLLRASDISQLAKDARRARVALAPDRHGAGTNAVALLGGAPFRFSFGEASFPRHQALAPHAALVVTPGLSHDIDTPQDLDRWRSGPATRGDVQSGRASEGPSYSGRAAT